MQFIFFLYAGGLYPRSGVILPVETGGETFPLMFPLYLLEEIGGSGNKGVSGAQESSWRPGGTCWEGAIGSVPLERIHRPIHSGIGDRLLRNTNTTLVTRITQRPKSRISGFFLPEIANTPESISSPAY